MVRQIANLILDLETRRRIIISELLGSKGRYGVAVERESGRAGEKKRQAVMIKDKTSRRILLGR